MNQDITQAIIDWHNGDNSAKENLYLLIYDHLRKLANQHKSKTDKKFGDQGVQAHINSTTAIVHEIYIKLEQGNPELFDNRKDFFLMISRSIHNILVDHARKSSAQKRQVELTVLVDDESEPFIDETLEQDQRLIDLSNAISVMENEYPRQAQAMQLKYFGGLLAKEISDLLTVSLSSVEKDLAFAKSWLKMRLAS